MAQYNKCTLLLQLTSIQFKVKLINSDRPALDSDVTLSNDSRHIMLSCASIMRTIRPQTQSTGISSVQDQRAQSNKLSHRGIFPFLAGKRHGCTMADTYAGGTRSIQGSTASNRKHKKCLTSINPYQDLSMPITGKCRCQCTRFTWHRISRISQRFSTGRVRDWTGFAPCRSVSGSPDARILRTRMDRIHYPLFRGVYFLYTGIQEDVEMRNDSQPTQKAQEIIPSRHRHLSMHSCSILNYSSSSTFQASRTRAAEPTNRVYTRR